MELNWPNWFWGESISDVLSMLQFLSPSASPGAFSGAQTWGRACSSRAENGRAGPAAREKEKLCKDQSFECTVPELGMLLCCGFCLGVHLSGHPSSGRGVMGQGAQPLCPQLCPRGISPLLLHK